MESQSPRGATGKLASLVVSVMDLHVRIALKEVDREKRRLIVGALLMGTALVLLTGALLVAHAALVIVLVEGAALDWLTAFLVVGAIDLVLAGLLRKQEQRVSRQFQAHGFRRVREIRRGPWSILLMQSQRLTAPRQLNRRCQDWSKAIDFH